MSSFGASPIPTPRNEVVRSYAPGTPERTKLIAELERQSASEVEVPVVIGGEKLRTGNLLPMVMPHAHAHRTGVCHQAGEAELTKALDAAEAARPGWIAMSFEDRAAIFLRAAELLATTWRDRVNAATMLGQSKTCHQAEIDSACELIDFFRFNVHYLQRIHAEQPISPNTAEWNRVEYRPLDGFVYAITPFNFTAIGGNLPTAPAMCGNTVIWKPAATALLSAHAVMELLEAAGLPPGVINFVPGNSTLVSQRVLADRRLAGIHFTGSTPVFNQLWREVAGNLDHYQLYPRLVGETGGKDFVFAHASADVDRLAVALLRGAFEYQGQKCSAASRVFVPDTLWPALRERLVAGMEAIRMGDVRDFSNFMGAVIDARAFAKHRGAIEEARGKLGAGVREVLGGACDDSLGYFVRPTTIVVDDPGYRTMSEELFGPILSVYVYPAAKFEHTLALCDRGTTYALTGAVFAQDRQALALAAERLRFAAGNFYVNDKPTGAVVGQQPFGGSRASGTNDKAGSMWNLIRWLSPRTIKENFAAPLDWRYPFMG